MTATVRPPFFRVLQIVIPSVFLLAGTATLATPHPWPFAGVLYGVGGVAIVAFAWRRRTHLRNLARARDGLALVGGKVFDAPSAVSDGEPLESAIFRGSMLGARTTRYRVSGRAGGRSLELGTAVVASRDADLFASYVYLREPGARGPFVVMSRGVTTTMLRVGMRDKHPVETGDARFDRAWIVDGDAALAAKVLDASLRERLVALASSFGAFQMGSIEATSTGVVVRLPGVMSTDLATTLRELAVTVHERLAQA